MVITGWRAAVLAILAVLVLILLATFLFWVGLAVAILLGLAALHLVYLPRLSARFGISPLVLSALLLPVLALIGWTLGGGPEDMLAGALIWAAGVALPRLAIWYFTHRLHVRTVLWTTYAGEAPRQNTENQDALTGVACPQCGLVSFPGTDRSRAICPRCGGPLTRASGDSSQRQIE